MTGVPGNSTVAAVLAVLERLGLLTGGSSGRR
jgi:hypothetical protein